MNERRPSQSEKIVPFAPASRAPGPDAVDKLDDAGRNVMGLLQQAATTSKENCNRALGVAHGISLQLRAAEDRIKELEADAHHFQERAIRAENWLQRISQEIQNRFLDQKEPALHRDFHRR
jgi:hypothetical protein